MNQPTLAEVCHLYDLGTPIAPPMRVFGGLLYRIYQVRTVRGEFAVKVLNPIVMGYHDVRARFRLSEQIAVTMAVAHLPVITALGNSNVIQDLTEATVIVYPWVNARCLLSPSPNHAQRIGSILGRIHALPLQFSDLPRPEPHFSSDDHERQWALLVQEAEAKDSVWSQEVRRLLPQIAAWERSSQEARLALQDRWVISHGDLDRKNVLWSDETSPWLIDWECAGFVQPACEAISTALDWSGQTVGHLDANAFSAFLSGYRREALLTAQDVGHGLQAYCGSWCGRLWFNLQRSLGLIACDTEEQALGSEGVFKTLALLRSAVVDLPALRRTHAL